MNDWRMYTDGSGQELESAAWHQVLKEIAQLNGTTHTLVHAAYGEHVDLVVAGGIVAHRKKPLCTPAIGKGRRVASFHRRLFPSFVFREEGVANSRLLP